MPRSQPSGVSAASELLQATYGDHEAGVAFLPHSHYRKFTSTEAIRRTLKNHEISDDNATNLALRIRDEHHPARRIYLIILRIEKPKKLIALLQTTTFSDNDLPLSFHPQGSGVPKNKHGVSTPDITSFFEGWKHRLKESFQDRQCEFLAPVLKSSQFHYKLFSNTPLPLEKEGHSKLTGFSSVAKVIFHPDHMGDSRTRSLALKRLHGTNDPDMLRVHRTELNNLSILREFDHPNLIKPIAAFTSHQKFQGTSFLFQWADMGNLRDVWNSQACTSGDIDMTQWMLRQIRGVSDALKLLADRHIRHSDLKPENLLCFYEDGELIIKITDVGISKVHIENTSKRPYATDAMHASRKYSAPEFEGIDEKKKMEMSLNTPSLKPDQQSTSSKLSRKFDIWSFGCICIEFLTWIQFGSGVASPNRNSLTDFDKRLEGVRKQKEFWDLPRSGNDYVVNREVVDQIEKLKAESSLPRLLEFIQDRMLEPVVSKRANAEEVLEALKSICEDFGADDGPPATFDTGPPATVDRQDCPKARPPSSARLAKPPSHFPRPATRPSFGLDKGKARLGNGSNGIDVQSRKLQDLWTAKPDNTLAKGFFSEQTDFCCPSRVDSLCSDCSMVQIWRPAFEIIRQVDKLSESSNCPLCRLLFATARYLHLDDTEELVCRWKGPELRVSDANDTRSSKLAVFLDPTSFLPGFLNGSGEFLLKSFQIGFPTLPPSNSTEQYKLLRYWLNVCDTEHHHERGRNEEQQSLEMPTRLVYVGDSQLRLETSNHSHVRYTALSHRWGDGPPFCTLSSNLDELRKKIPFELLPRNFQDAICVTRALRLSYLWIDSLCIIQENEEDWRREAARMGQVFSNAYCAIAASSATSSVQGFLSRPEQPPLFATLSGPENTRLFVSECLENFHHDVESAPLNTRGWVFQERVLSRRTLHFTKNQVYWECGNGVHSERLIKLTNPHAALLGDSKFPESILPFHKDGRQTLFQVLYRLYSTLDFTHIADHAVAITGLEQRLVQTFNTRGSFGLFERYFQRSLLWHRRGGSFLERIVFPNNRPVPSWSWMAYKGPIDYMDAPFGAVDWCLSSEAFFDAQEAQSGIRPTPTVKSSALMLSQAETVGRLRLDEDLIPQGDDLRCVVVGKNKTLDEHGDRTWYVLVISEDPKHTGRYRRAGVGWLSGRHIGYDERQLSWAHGVGRNVEGFGSTVIGDLIVPDFQSLLHTLINSLLVALITEAQSLSTQHCQQEPTHRHSPPSQEERLDAPNTEEHDTPSHLKTGKRAGTRSVTTEATETTMQNVLDEGHQNWLASLQGTFKLAKDTSVTDVSVATVLSQLRRARRSSATDVTGRSFIPLGDLIEILTPRVVRGVLREIFHKTPEVVKGMAAAIYVNGRPRLLKVMGTLMLIEKMKVLPNFIKGNISDDQLPLTLEPWDLNRPGTRLLDRNKKHLPELDLAKWSYPLAESFVAKQAELCSPFFTIRDDPSGEVDYYKLSSTTILPFLDIGRIAPRNGGFGTVNKVQIERSHLACSLGTPTPEYLAIKKLHQYDVTLEAHPKEVDALTRRVVVPTHSRGHVSRLLFTFLLGDSYFMAFEWADGNLKELWEKDPSRFQPANPNDSRWFFEQCLGLVFGLDGIHNSKASFNMNNNADIRFVLKNAYGRHSDIKPENILLYEASEAEKIMANGNVSAPRLVLADLGCAQFNTTLTKSVVRISRVSGMTATYSAPETETVRIVGPKYDIWALGCVFLEHASVFIEGSVDVVHEFSSRRNAEDKLAHTDPEHSHKYTGNTFYLLCDSTVGEKKIGFCNAVTKKAVADWVKRLTSHDNCSSAMVDFLKMVCDEMLVVDCETRSDTKRLQGALREIITKCGDNDEYACSSRSQPRKRRRTVAANSSTQRQDQDEALLHVGILPGADEDPEDPHGQLRSGNPGIPEIVLPFEPVSMPLGLEETLEKLDSLGRRARQGNDGS
ncbi:hypothetical protein F5X68DRAFT_172126 [Plectosphaerella plurivora]|uniref:Protein kinase domain-containing protein n=1 Tax=Plectosphaerella plurivora TaxID=936078 RepID=A0A9P9A888_9PEZI|nr:hypothetical protein F5X68DRAFT_172126 [Plectosphaerella plurivora]